MNRIAGFIFILLFFSRCVSEIDYLTDEDAIINPQDELIYALIGSENEPVIYYENTRQITESINFQFKKMDEAILKINGFPSSIDLTKIDNNKRTYNTVSNWSALPGDTIDLNMKEIAGQCILPNKVPFNVIIDSVSENSSRYTFHAKMLLNKSQVVDGCVINFQLQYLDQFFPSPFNNKGGERMKGGVDHTFINKYYTKQGLENSTLEFEIYIFKNYYVNNKPVKLADNLDFKGKLNLKTSFYHLDENIMEYLEKEQLNANGIENPLAIYSPSFMNLENAFGFIGCYTSAESNLSY